MPSYTQYKRQMAVLDADDTEIESWITVRGNHIPIMKGQSKGDAVKSFIEKKSGSGGAKSSTKKEYDPEFETVRKNALANGKLYGGKYTQRSKQAAYKEYKNDTSSEENQRAANKWVNSELVAKQSKPSDSMGRPPKKKYEGPTLGEIEKGGADLSKLKHELNRWYYGFFDEEGKKMTPQQLVDRMGDMLSQTTGKRNHSEVRVQELFPDMIKNVKEHIKGLGGSEKKLSKPSDSRGRDKLDEDTKQDIKYWANAVRNSSTKKTMFTVGSILGIKANTEEMEDFRDEYAGEDGTGHQSLSRLIADVKKIKRGEQKDRFGICKKYTPDEVLDILDYMQSRYHKRDKDLDW